MFLKKVSTNCRDEMSCLEYALLSFLENITIAEFVNGSFGLVKTNSQKVGSLDNSQKCLIENFQGEYKQSSKCFSNTIKLIVVIS
ncbi:hypothetical protein [Candidatus Enterococcus leclercqii]|uniref:hypothetical protein n=1 Tax=Candidatus Enterococcus leclercqii TaxID=1857218 RepID=UPI00137A4604|nr:hypothetical protein [Enterococcus sp. CU9D]